MMFFKRRREWRQPPVLDGHGVKPTTPRPSPDSTRVTYVVRRRSDRDEEMRALKARIAELEQDVAEGLDAVLVIASRALAAAGGITGVGAAEVHEKADRIGDIVQRLKAMQP